MTAESLLPFYGYVGTAASAAIAAAVLASLHRSRQRPWLRSWSWSWLFLTFHSLLSAAAYIAARTGVGAQPRVALASLAAIAGFAQLVFLLSGAREAATGMLFPRARLAPVLAAASVVAILMALPGSSDPSAAFLRYTLRFGVRSLTAGVVFLVAALIVWRGLGAAPSLGRSLVTGSLAVTGVHYLHYLVVGVGGFASGTRSPLLTLLSSVDVLLAVVTVLGIVILLLEAERNAAVAAAAQLEHMAGHDALTGLPNRLMLLERTAQALRRASRDRRSVAVLSLDIDAFKLLNDSLGHGLGDELLRSVGTRLKGAVRETDTVARLSGDEFGLLLEVRDAEEAEVVVEKLRAAARRPFVLHGREIHVTMSGGLAISPRHAETPEALLAAADIASARAREDGRDTVRTFDSSMNEAARKTVALEGAIRKALVDGELRLCYQPLVSVATGRIEGFEALLRWESAELGNVPPSDFIHLAEANGLIVPIGRWALRSACAQAREWQKAGTPARVSVNLSAREFRQPDLYLTVRNTLSETGLPAQLLDLEITERVAMESPDVSQFVLRELRSLGVSISIDDFGTGYSSLAYLRSFPIDTLKIDGSFIQAMVGDPQSAAIVRSVIDLAHHLKLGTVAEGVETEEQAAVLRRASCDRIQGYLISRPLPAPEATRLLREDHRAARAAAGSVA
ncbi:MAG: bifunctional diguanylate cyclase/phosphodiesterase [Holophagales bacterium]|nr:bifunctional diguanylate cyclase/phosphodiesterase [Holophagales bacterium]